MNINMKHLLHLLLFLFTWLSSSAAPIFVKVGYLNYDLSFPKPTNQNLESEIKIGVCNFARSGILENSFSQKANLWESYVRENRAREGNIGLCRGRGR